MIKVRKTDKMIYLQGYKFSDRSYQVRRLCVYVGIDDNGKRYYNIGERLWKYSGIRKRNVEVQENDRKQRMRDENE